MRLLVSVLAVLMIASCGRKSDPPANEKDEVTFAVTRWSAKSELFMEHPPLVAGETHRFAIHFTDLRDFRPLTSGTVEVLFKGSDGREERFRSEAPSRPGIFGADVRPSQPGQFSMVLRLAAPGLDDQHDAGEVTVYPNAEAAAKATPPEEEEGITFLKEQQWNLDFATAMAGERPMRESFPVPGAIEPRSGGEAQLIAPVAGKLIVERPVTVATTVRQGQILAEIVPQIASAANEAELQAEATAAESAFALARKERERMERLVAAKAVATKRLDEAQAAEANAQAKLEAVRATLSQNRAVRGGSSNVPSSATYAIRSPISGNVAEAAVAAGASVEAGQLLFRVVAADVVNVRADVPEAEGARLARVSGGEIDLGDRSLPLGRIVGRGAVLDPQTRTVPALFELHNRGGLPIGQSVTVRLFTGEKQNQIAVPESAIVDDGGQPIVFVHVAGESFARRAVRLGAREGGFVQVLEGVKRGERVVARGAYLIRLAALSPQVPAHGHVH
jgi:membrane fusion protein, heavy metal efflux system